MSTLHLKRGSTRPKFPEDGKLRLFSMRFCPFAQRVHLVLDAKNIPYHTAFINLAEKPEWFLEVSFTGNVPALEIPGEKGAPLVESLIISDYLDEKYPQNPLQSKDPLQRARDRILIERFNAFITNYYRFLNNHEVDGAPGAITELTNTLDIFEDELKSRKTKFFGGNSKPAMVDYMIWPWCERSDMLKYFLHDKYEMDKARFGELLKWKEEMKRDNAVKMHFISPEDHFKHRQSKLANKPDYDFLALGTAKKMRYL